MGNLATDTVVTPAEGPGRYTADLSKDWEIWGPAGDHGLLHAGGDVWSDDGRLLATGITQLLATPTRR